MFSTDLSSTPRAGMPDGTSLSWMLGEERLKPAPISGRSAGAIVRGASMNGPLFGLGGLTCFNGLLGPKVGVVGATVPWGRRTDFELTAPDRALARKDSPTAAMPLNPAAFPFPVMPMLPDP